MHTDTTIQSLDDLTTDLGHQLRQFRTETCPAYQTYELKRETTARHRRQKETTASSTNAKKDNPSSQRGRLPKAFNMQTYKFHALGDYVEAIKTYGTVDSYSTEVVSNS